MKPTLFILAAGMGSRYGGLKQIDGVGPNGETIMDYSVYDALRAGFGKIVFVIRHDFEEQFRDKVITKYQDHIEVEVVFQELNYLPEGFTLNPDRVKPWGTGHAVLMGKEAIHEPFAVINADDYYGPESFKVLADALSALEGKENEYCMVGFKIQNTLSENGGVSRGLCSVSENGYLTAVNECHNIQRKGDILVHTLADGNEVEFPADAYVSMNMWGFTPDYFTHTEKAFIEFLRQNSEQLKSEFYIPTVVNDLIQNQTITLKVEETPSKWFGVTYAADKEATAQQLRLLSEQGIYPDKLW